MKTKNKNSVLVKVQLTAINVVSKPQRRMLMPKRKSKVFDYVPMPEYEIDPKLVQVQFRPVEAKRPLHIGILTLQKEDFMKLGVTVGDFMNIEVSKGQAKPV